LTLAGHTGSVLRWQVSSNGGATWTDIANTNTTYTSGALNTPGTYWYRAQVQSGVCNVENSAYAIITVNPTTVGGSITGGSTPICYGVNTGVMTLSGHTGSVLKWEKRVDSGAWQDISTTNTTYSEVPSASGTWDYRALVQSGVCPSVYSATRTIIVRPRFQLAQLHDDASICVNTSTNFNVTMTGGVSPYTVTYTKAGVPQPVLNNYISGTNINTGLLASTTVFALQSVTDANGCPAESLGTPITITVGSTPATATLTGSGDACSGATSWIRSVITGGAPPYTINYTRNGIAQPPITPYSSGTNFSLGVLPVGTYNYQITAVTDNCGNPVPPGSLPGVYTINIQPIPDASGTNPASQNICSNGTANITLNSTVPFTIFSWTVASVPAAGYSWTGGKDPVAGSITDADGNGTELLSRQLQHNHNAAVTVTYTITPTGPGATACAGPVITRTVIVDPVPAISNMTATTCSGTVFSATPANGTNGVVPAGTTYSWGAPVVTGGMTGGAAGSGASITGTLNNPTNTSQTATYTVTPTSGSCTGATFTVTVTVNPTPAITAMTASTCSATAFTVTPVNVTNGIVPAGTTYSWAAPVVTGGLTGGAAGTNQTNIGGNLTNPTNTPQTATYTVTPTSGSCTGTSFTVTVTVNPRPAINNMTTSVCSGTGFTAAPANGVNGIVPAGTTYSWPAPVVTGGMTGGAAGANQADISGTLNNPTNTSQTATYTVTPTSGSCTGATFTVTVTVNPTPSVSNMTATACSGSAFTVTPVNGTNGIVPVGTTYSWGVPVVTGGLTGGAAGSGANITGNLTNPTNTPQTATYTVTPVSGTCTGANFTVTVTINPRPSINNLTATTCSAAAFTVTPANGTDGIVPAGTTYTWAAPVVTGGMTGGAAGTNQPNITGNLTNPTNTPQTATYTVTPVSGSCTGANFTVTVTVNPKPSINNMTASICSEGSFTVTPVNGVNGIVPAGTTYSWGAPVVTGGITGGAAGSGANIAGTLTNPTNSPQTATYTVTPVSGSCTGSTFTVTVTVNPKPAINDMTGTTCSAAAFTVTPVNVTNGIVPAGTTYTWPAPVVTGGMTGGAAGTNQTNINGNLTNPTNVPQTATYTVTPTSGSCTGPSFTVTVTVNPKPSINNMTAVICNNGTFTVTPANGVNGIVPAGTTYSWPAPVVTGGITGGAAGTNQPNISGTLTNPTAAPQTATYTVTPLSGSCTGSTFTVTVTVNPTPTLSSSLTPPDVCSNSVFSYNPTSATAGTTFSWVRNPVAGITPAGPTSGINNPNETLRNLTSAPMAVTYEYTLTANGCSNVQNVVVNIKPEPVINPGQTVSVCSGIAMNYQVLMSNFTNPGDNVTFTWPAPVLAPVNPNFSGGTARAVPSSANITDTFINTMGFIGTATYTITPVKNGCAGTPETVVVSVGAAPVLDPGLDKFVCSNTATGLLLKEAAGSVVPTHYNIISVTVAGGLTADAGNAAIPNNNAPANYLSNDKYRNTTGVNKTVVYRVQPVLAPDCFGAPVDVTITIRPEPVILPGQTKTVCSGVPIGKEVLLVPANTPAGTLFNWNAPVLSDLSSQGSAGVNVAADPAGTIHINDMINNYAAAPITATYTITPVSSFGCAGDPVPVVITINPEPIPQVISGRDKICVNEVNLVYSVNPVGGSTFHWTVDPSIGTKTFDFNTNAILINAAAVAGSGNITVYETNSYTCDGDPSSLAVEVYAVPAAEVITGPLTVCANSTHIYSVTNRAGSVYNWNVPGGAAIIGDPSASSITVVFANVGGTISVRETNAAGCITNHTPVSVTVNPLPTAQISGTTIICDGSSANLTVDFTGIGPWTFTYALNGVPQTPVNTSDDPYTLAVTQAGNYTIVNVTDATTCTNTGTGSATVSYYPKPTGIISGTTELCRGNSATLTMTFTGTAPYTFTYTDGVTPVTVNNHPTAVYTVNVSPLNTTTYTLVSLTDGNSCDGVISGSAVITVNIPPALTLTGTNLTCYNDNTGAVDLEVTGTGPFGYSWTGPDLFTANTQDINGLKAGIYAVVVTDSKGCTSTGNITITQPGQLNATLSSTNISCYGVPEGTITISLPSGGSGSYEYTIDGGLNWQASGNFTNLNPGTYNVIMRDALSTVCTRVLDPARVLTGPAQMTATVTKTDVNCFGANNGTITISAPAGGSGTYQYWITGKAWQGSGSFTNLAPGTYTVKMRDAAVTTCEVVLGPDQVITEPPVLSATVASTNITCFGAADGTITISSPAGGHGNYEYSINGGSSWQASGNYTSLAPGNYNVQIRDKDYNTCVVILNPALTITQPAILSANISSTNVTCNGANDGTITVSGASGGYGTYDYTIDGGTNWQASGNFTNLAPGSYDVRIRDAVNQACVIILNNGVTITEPAALNAVVVKSDISCFGANNGTISITTPSGGYGTYQYTVNGGTDWFDSGNFSGLTPGTYNVQMRDKAQPACVKILDAALVISEPAVLSATVASTDVTCNGANDGTITISGAAGGYGTYQYSINGGASWQGSGNYTSLSPGTYNVRIRDAANIGCVIVLDPALMISEPPAVTATVSKSNVTCFGASDGTITINGAAGGHGTFEYTIDGGANWQASNSFTALGPGYYNVKIRDAAYPGCIVTLNSSLVITEPPVLNANVAKTNVTCNGANNGTITISSPTGGYGTYEYSITGTWQASGNFTNLAPGSYNVQIRDAANPLCVITLNPALVITEPAVLNADVAKTDVTCFGANNGTITISNPTGGYGTYEYSINGGTTWSGLGSFTNLAPNTYDVRIRDAANTGCVIVLNPALVITQPPVLSATVSKTNVTCFGAADGTITISSPAGGYGTYEYSINGGGSWQASGDFTNLAPGNYNVQIRDAAYPTCVIVLNNSLSITQPAVLNAVVTPTMVTCNGANDGIITITSPTGGYGTYEYSINGGGSWSGSGTFPGLAPGSYNVQIRDAANTGCVIILNPALQITEPAVLNANVASTNVTCNGANDGTITISAPTGGYGTYEYSINGGGAWQGTGTFTALAPNTYDVRIRDKAHTGCVIILNPALQITEPAVLSATVASTNVTCNGANDGTITISSPAGGYGTYQYSVNGGTTWSGLGTFTNLAPNTYDVRIRDAANPACVIILDPALVITQPAVLSADVARTNVTCNGANDGTITISNPAGGYGTYEYTINGGATWQATGSFTNLAPGFYNVQIRDAVYTNCVKILNGSLQITEPAVLGANVSKTNVTCNGANDGTITISSPTGGYGTYEYSITGTWQASGNFTNLAPGSYNVQIRDAANPLCVITLNPALVITEPAVLNADVAKTDVTCFGANNGTITISNPSGGYGSYQYSIDGGTNWSGFGFFNNLAPNTYDVRIRDAANPLCVVTLNGALTITQPPVLSATVAKTDVTCFGGADGTITITNPLGGYGTYEYSINGGGSWQASGNFTSLSPGTYNVLIRDALYTTCIIVLDNAMSITQPAILSATVTKTDVTCNGANDGIINITSPSGGYGSYEYTITGGAPWSASGNFTGLAPGTYDVRIRDAANPACVVVLYPNMQITQPLTLTMTTSGDIMLNCFGDMTGSGTFYAAGGTLPYTFTLVSNTTGGTLAAPGFNSQTFFGAGAGSVTVRVTDAHNCTAQATINVSQPADLTPGSIAGDQVLCSGQNPAQLTEVTAPTGGPGAYNYQWQYATNPAGPFINIAGANTVNYTPPAGATMTLYYRRMVTSGVCTPVYSNVVEILVNPRPVAILSGGATICPGESAILKVNLPVGTGPFELEIDNLGVVSNYTTDADIVVSPLVTTVYKLNRVRDANGCEVTAPSANLFGTATITVRDLPAITLHPVDKITCEFGMVTYSVTATGSDLSYQWYVDDGTGFTPVIDGGIYFGAQTPMLFLFGTSRLMDGYDYRVEVTGCSVTVTSTSANLTVNTAPEILFQPKDTTICSGQNASFQVTAQGTGLIYQWQVNKGAGFVNVTDDANFSGSDSPILSITNAPGSFNNWIFRVRITGTCGAPVFSNFSILRVNVPPAVTLNPVNRAICANGGPVYFTGNGSGMIDSLRWQMFDGSSWVDIYDNAIYSGTTSQQLTLVNVPLSYNGNRYRLALKAFCANTYTNEAVLTVNSNPVVDFSAVSPVNACGGVPVTLNGNPTGGSGTYTQHIWTGDVGPLNNYFIQSPTFTSQIAGTYNLNYKVRDTNGCFGDGNLVVNVDAPDATYAKDATLGCTPLTVNFTKDMTGIAKFWWNFGDGSPIDSLNANPTHIFTNVNPGSIEYRNVELKVRSAGGCYDTFTSMVTIYPEVDASFTASPTVVCSGSTITFTALPGASKYFWEFGDGASGYGTNVAVHMYTNLTTSPEVLTVRLTTTSFYNCTNTQTLNITVMPTPIPQFTATPASQNFVAPGVSVSFTNQTNPGTWTWLWRFGDGNISAAENPVHTYTATGTFNVTLRVSNANCSDSVTHPVYILPPPPVANFDSIPSGCSPLYVSFNNTSLNTEVPGTTYLWDFGDGNTSTVKNPTYTYTAPGIYRITLVVRGPGGQSMKQQIVEAYVSPKAYFEVSPMNVFVNDERVRMFNLSTNADYFVWEFGDGDTSHVKDPFHKYMDEGVYDITLHAYSSNGCMDTWTLSPGVTVEPAGVIRFSTVFRPNKDGPIERTDLPTGGDEIDQFFFPPIREKVLNYKLQIFNRWGTLIFESRDINVPWNGYYKGKLCRQGVYVWYVEGKYANGKPFKKTGDVTLLH